MTTPGFAKISQRLSPGYTWLDLFTVDATNIGGPIERWTPSANGNAPVMMGGNPYYPVPIDASGFEYNGQGPLPTPKLRVANTNNAAMQVLIANNDLLGAVVTRVQTWACFLDTGEYADPEATTMPDVYRVNRKSHADKNFVELELAASTDMQGKKLPFRLVLQQVCMRSYRSWNGTNFVQGQCPYTGDAYFDSFDNPQTDPSKDQCSRKLSGCLARYGQSEPLPTWGFPGVGLSAG
jgi:lambda family phage minor tail protein L